MFVAAAGAGKTTTLVNRAHAITDGRVLITTFTNANEQEIKKKFVELFGCVPGHVYVQSFWSFLLQHGIRPFQGGLYEHNISGTFLVQGKSVPFIPEWRFKDHYLTKDGKVYSDKLSKLTVRCNEKSKGNVISRLEKCFKYIFIDEVQDFASWDLEFFKLLFNSEIQIIMVGDPRQGTFSTVSGGRYSKYAKSNIMKFFSDEADKVAVDETSLVKSHRCVQEICNTADKLYPAYPGTTSGNETKSEHDGVFVVDSESVDEYLNRYRPMQLRDSVSTDVNPGYEVMNFGGSKGLQFERVLIYPTKPMQKWFVDPSAELADMSRAKLYVALTRARQSAAIVKTDKKMIFGDLKKFET